MTSPALTAAIARQLGPPGADETAECSISPLERTVSSARHLDARAGTFRDPLSCPGSRPATHKSLWVERRRGHGGLERAEPLALRVPNAVASAAGRLTTYSTY